MITSTYIHLNIFLIFLSALSVGGVTYSDFIFTEGGDNPQCTYKCPGFDIKQSDGETPVLEFWRVGSIFSLSLLSVPFWPGEVAPFGVTSVGQREIFHYLLETI